MAARKKITTHLLREKKKNKDKISMLTAYDYPTAKILDDTDIDILLVGDSLGNVVLGYENTLPVTMAEMLHHAKAVVRGTKNAMVIADMPFMSYQLSDDEAFANASRFIKEAGAIKSSMVLGLYFSSQTEKSFFINHPRLIYIQSVLQNNVDFLE